MLNFCLYRVHVYPKGQRLLDLGLEELPRWELFRKIALESPSLETPSGRVWHLGNVEVLDHNGLYLAIGRTSSAKVEVYTDGNFVEAEFDAAPYTHVFLDFPMEVCAIASKAKLCQNTNTVARYLVRLLSQSPTAIRAGASLEIDPIRDPSEFLAYLERATSISKFWMTLSRPNAWDVNKLIVDPLQATLQEVNGTDGRLAVSGKALDGAKLQDITRSCAATGSDAGAVLDVDGERRKRKRLKAGSATLQVDQVADKEEKLRFMQQIRQVYKRIRHGD